MTLQELRNKTRVERTGLRGRYSVIVNYRGKEYRCMSYNSLAWDRLDDDNYRDSDVAGYYTNKGAYQAFYDECKRKNGIGEYR